MVVEWDEGALLFRNSVQKFAYIDLPTGREDVHEVARGEWMALPAIDDGYQWADTARCRAVTDEKMTKLTKYGSYYLTEHHI